MNCFYDASLYLTADRIIKRIGWNNKRFREQYEALWNSFVGTKLGVVGGFRLEEGEGLLYWQDKPIPFQKEELDSGDCLLFLKKSADREGLFKRVLDTLDESIQIYDQDANIIFFNRTGREIVGLEGDIEGKNLLEVFEVAREDSTTLEALRMKAPVKNRFKHYYSKQGKELFTVNSAFPIIDNGRTIAALALEENISVISRKAEQLEKLQNAMREKVMDATAQNRTTGYTLDDLIGKAPKLCALKELARRVAGQENNILIVGETGTGKEILAQSIHHASSRKKGPFIALNCAAIPDTLIESILFGTVKGSFTGSFDKPGLLEEANKGTLFLDELNSMSLAMQAKVLRALQEKNFRRVGGNKEYKTDVRVISSCNENPLSLMEEKVLRSDLFYRLATIILEIPPLRERVDDIEELVWHHITQIRSTYAFPFKEIEPAVFWQMQQYAWPGNVRELFHAVDYAMNVASDDVFRLKYLPAYCFRKTEQEIKRGAYTSDQEISPGTLQEQVELFEADIIDKTLKHSFGNVSQAARQLGLSRQSLQYRIRKYGLVN